VWYFKSHSDIEPGVQLHGPYFMIRMKSSSNTKARTTGLDLTLDLARAMTGCNRARNKLFFNFGMLLLEVRYGEPSGELKRSILKASVVDGGNIVTRNFYFLFRT